MHFSSQLIKEREQTQATCAHFENELDETTCKKIIDYCKLNLTLEKGGIGGSTGGSQASTDLFVKSVRNSDIGWIRPNEEIDYKGGELQIEVDARDDKPVTGSRKRGSMIFFPSYLRHRVNPVTSGHRYSLVSWLSGNPHK